MVSMKTYLEILEKLDPTIMQDCQRLKELSKLKQAKDKYECAYLDFIENVQK
jgi:hypothetical protein